jgi:DnaJ family protein C protein 11
VTKVETTYRDEDSTLKVKGVVASDYYLVPPALAISLSRKLFRSGPERGKITLHLGRRFPSLALMYLSPPSMNLTALVRQKQSLPSISGFRYRAIEKAFGISFMGILPKLSASAAVTFTELSTRIRVALEYGLQGLSWSLSAQWSSDAAEVSASTVIQSTAILLQIELVKLSLLLYL